MNVLSMASMDESIASSHDLQRYAQRRRQHPTFIDRGAVVHSCSKLVFQNDSAASVAIVLWSLGTMKFSLSNEPDTLQLCEECLETVSSWRNVNAEAMSLSLIGLARIGFKYASSDTNLDTLIDNLLNAAPQALATMNEQQIANSVWSMGKIGVPWSPLPLRVKRAITKGVSRTYASMCPQGVANTVQGLSKLDGLNWISLHEFVKEDLCSALLRTLPQMNEQELSSSISGLGRLGTDWQSLSSDLQLLIIQGYTSKLYEMDSRGVAMCIHGLGRMHADITSMSTQVRASVEQSIIAFTSLQLTKANSQELSNILYGLGRMKITFSDLPDINRISILAILHLEISSMCAKGLANALYGLMRMGLKLSHLNSVSHVLLWSSLSRQLDAMNEVELGLTLLACGGMGVIHTHVPNNVLNNIFTHLEDLIPNMTVQGVTTLASGIHALHLTWADLPPSLGAKLMLSITRLAQESTTPAIALSLVQSLACINIHWSYLTSHTQNVLLDSLHIIEQTTLHSRVSMSCVLTALGKMNVNWIDLSDQFQTSVFSTITREVHSFDDAQLVATLSGLASVHIRWESMPQPLRFSLKLSLQKLCADMGETSIASVIMSLAKLEVNWKGDLGETTRDALRLAIGGQARLSELSLSSILYGLAKMNRPWSDLSPIVSRVLKEAIVVCHIKQECTAQGVSSILYGLANMQASWTELSSSVRLALVKEVVKVAPHTSEAQLTNIVWSLVKLGVTWSLVPQSVCASILARIETLCTDMNRMHLASVLFTLGSMGRPWDELPSSLRDALLTALLRTQSSTYNTSSSSSGNPAQSLSMAMVGLGNLQVRHHNMPREVTATLKASFKRHIQDMSGAQLASVLTGMGRIGWPLSCLDATEISILYSSCTSVLAGATIADSSALVSSLSTLGLQWRSLPFALQTQVMSAAARIGQEGKSDDVAKVSFALGSMECVWELMQRQVRASLMEGIVRVSSTLSAQSAANLMYAVSLLCFDVSDAKVHQELLPVHLALLKTITRVNVGSFYEKERSQVLIFLQFLRHFTRLGARPSPFIFTVNEEDVPLSRLHMSVVSALTEELESKCTKFELKNEYSAFGGAFPIDTTVFSEGRVVAFIEIDGPHHYKRGRLRRKDVLKECLYRKKHPEAVFARVRHDQVRKLGMHEVGVKVANCVSICDPSKAGWINRSAERELKRTLQGDSARYSEDGY